MRDTFVAVNTGLILAKGDLVLGRCTTILLGIVHEMKVVAVAALTTVGSLESVPFMLGKREALGIEFFRCVD